MWLGRLEPSETWLIESFAGSVMDSLGYTRTTSLPIHRELQTALRAYLQPSRDDRAMHICTYLRRIGDEERATAYGHSLHVCEVRGSVIRSRSVKTLLLALVRGAKACMSSAVRSSRWRYA